jgi:hypothetical protein
MYYFRVSFFVLLCFIFSPYVKAEEVKLKENLNVKVVNTFVEKVFFDKKFQKKFKKISFWDGLDINKKEKQFKVIFFRYGIEFTIKYHWRSYYSGICLGVDSKSTSYSVVDHGLDGKVNFGTLSSFDDSSDKIFAKFNEEGLEYEKFYQKKYNQILLVIKELLNE